MTRRDTISYCGGVIIVSRSSFESCLGSPLSLCYQIFYVILGFYDSCVHRGMSRDEVLYGKVLPYLPIYPAVGKYWLN